MSSRYVGMILLALIFGATVGCKPSYEGTNIPVGGECAVGDAASSCTSGSYCQATGKEEDKGGTYIQRGRCAAQKAENAACKMDEECSAPFKCVAEAAKPAQPGQPYPDLDASMNAPRKCTLPK